MELQQSSWRGPEVSEKPLRILIADDQPYIRRAVRALLESHQGWEVCGEASDGREAIRKTGELQPDIVVMDMFMPNLNGLEATREIHHAYRDAKVLILTLHDLPDLSRAARDAGAKGLVLKSDSNLFLIPAIEAIGNSEMYFAYKQ
jgi:DNA-binding NarL/FixJ family response regulator